MKLKQKLKSYFKTKDTSESAVELLRMFILPFMNLWDPNASVDDALAAFFSQEDRKFYHGTAIRYFRLPGRIKIAGDRFMNKPGPREVASGTKMLIVVDRRDQTVKIELHTGKKEREFLLTRGEFESITRHIAVTDT